LTLNDIDVTPNANTTLKKRQSFNPPRAEIMNVSNQTILELSAQIVAAHAGNNQVETDALPSMIRNVYNTLAALGPINGHIPAIVMHTHATANGIEHDHAAHNGHAHNVYEHPMYGPTVFADHLICMEDGLSMKMLKRHLLTVHGMTPQEYRQKWGLPDDYQMVAAEYAKLRSSLALQSGLGLKPEDRPAKGRKGRRRNGA
jgi:predicted transcriptional regulator